MAEMFEERRRFPRIEAELLVRYKVLKTSDQKQEATTKNLSAGGICLVSRERFKPGTVLALDIQFPKSDKPLLAGGKVIWSDKSRLGPSPAGHQRFDNGVEFVEISAGDRQRIIEHINSQQGQTKPEGWKVGIVRDLPEKDKSG